MARPGKDAVAPINIEVSGHSGMIPLQDYVKSSFSAVGDDGHSPYVDELTGTWFEWNGTAYEDTGITAKGEKGADGEPGADGDGTQTIYTNWQHLSINAIRRQSGGG